MEHAHRTPVRAQSRPARRQLKVLVVDDCPLNRMQVAELLGEWGCLAEVASNGAEAVQLATQFQFDLIVMDLAMPVMDGVAATRKIRALEASDPSRRAVPIVAHTSLDVPLDSQLLVRVGLNGILPKPVGPFSLDSCLKRWCLQTVRSL
jgi:CheY-like chemotaxis protein